MHQSYPGVRRRRVSQPSIHLPRAVYFPSIKTGFDSFSRFSFGAKKSSLAPITRPPSRSAAKSANFVKSVIPCLAAGICPPVRREIRRAQRFSVLAKTWREPFRAVGVPGKVSTCADAPACCHPPEKSRRDRKSPDLRRILSQSNPCDGSISPAWRGPYSSTPQLESENNRASELPSTLPPNSPVKSLCLPTRARNRLPFEVSFPVGMANGPSQSDRWCHFQVRSKVLRNSRVRGSAGRT